jgi:CBS domain-containing protein
MKREIASQKTVGDVMARDLVTLRLDDTLRLADDLMNLAHLRHFPVLDGEKVAGVVNQSALLHASMVSLIRHRHDQPRHALGAVVIKQVMEPAVTVSADTGIHDAARMMVEREIECLLVLKEQKLIGLVTRTDLLRELAKE